MSEEIEYTISKDDIRELEVVTFKGHIVVIDSELEAEKAIKFLNRQPLLGFDTETKPSFQKGRSHKVALVQIATQEECFLFRINKIGVTKALQELFQNENIIKIGLSIRDDFAMLHKVSNFEPKGFVELQHLAKEYHIKEMSLQKIYAILFGKRIAKSQQLSNWEHETLSEGQQRYAATDAWACLRIYHALLEPTFEYFKQPKRVNAPETNQ